MARFTTQRPLSIQDKVIAGVLLLQSTLGIFWSFPLASKIGAPGALPAANLALAAIGIVAGLGWLGRRRWAVYLALVFFLAQLVRVIPPTFEWTPTIAFKFNLALDWLLKGELGINLFALVMLLWVGARAFAADSSFKRDPFRASAWFRR